MHKKNIITSGKKLGETKKALILLHGRGADAQDILGLASHLAVKEFALLAPQATNFTWYPFSFLAPPPQNEPWLTSAIEIIEDLVREANRAGISDDGIFFCGFSQGACLALEFAARHARRWGGVAAFTGGLIGDRIYDERYHGDFGGMPAFIGSADPDPHVPAARVRETTEKLGKMNASVTQKFYPHIGHTIVPDEIEMANNLIFAA